MARPRKPGKDSPERRRWEATNPAFAWLASNPLENKYAKMARACKCGRQTIYNWLTGHSNPDLEKVQMIAKFVQADPAEFVKAWLEWWKQGVEQGFIEKTMAAQRFLRMLDILRPKE
jgi:transcriptional regulator with XRE-family HTH domain